MTPLFAHRSRGERAFERLYRRHVNAVYRYALAVLHNEADAEDVTQTTFLNAYRAFQRGQRPERPHNWLIKIAHNVCRQRFRDSSRRPQEVELDERRAAAAADDSEVPTAAEIRRALGFLGFNQRAALVMRELEGRSYAEIAQILDVSVGAVETLLFRARRALREQLEGGLTCREAELTISRLSEQRLPSSERGALRAHLRECKECAALERSQRAQTAALKSLGAVPLPASLGSFFGGGSTAATGVGIGTKIAVALGAGLIATSVSHDAVRVVDAEAASSPVAAGSAPERATGSFAAFSTARSARERASFRARQRHAASSPQKRTSNVSARAGKASVGTAPGAAPATPAGDIVHVEVPALPKRIELPPVELPRVPQVPELPVHVPPVTPPLPPPPPLPLPPPPRLP